MLISKLRFDKRGRLTFPDSFLKANDVQKSSWVEVHPVGGRTDAVKLVFLNPCNEESEGDKCI